MTEILICRQLVKKIAEELNISVKATDIVKVSSGKNQVYAVQHGDITIIAWHLGPGEWTFRTIGL